MVKRMIVPERFRSNNHYATRMFRREQGADDREFIEHFIKHTQSHDDQDDDELKQAQDDSLGPEAIKSATGVSAAYAAWSENARGVPHPQV